METKEELLIAKIMSEYGDVLNSTLGFDQNDGHLLPCLEPSDIENVIKNIEGPPKKRIQFHKLIKDLKGTSESTSAAPVSKKPRYDEPLSYDTRFLELLQSIGSVQESIRQGQKILAESIRQGQRSQEELLKSLEESIRQGQKSQEESTHQSQEQLLKSLAESIRQGQKSQEESTRQSQKSQEELLRLIQEMPLDEMSVSFSKASGEKVVDMFGYFNLHELDATRSDFISDAEFEALPRPDISDMKWGDSEVGSTPAALKHVNEALINHGANLAHQIVDENNILLNDRSHHFKLVNVCEQNHLCLRTSSTKFRGGIDGVILPMKVSKSSFQFQMRAAIELKHPEQVVDKSRWQQATNQARVQIVVANMLSHHPVMHLLTDLVTKFKLFKIVDNCVYEYDCPDASTAFKCLASWIKWSSTEPNFIYDESRTDLNENLKPSVMGLINLQKKSHSIDLRDELKLDILEDLDPEERASYLYETLMNRFGVLEISDDCQKAPIKDFSSTHFSMYA